ncbi:MAG: hypothetical protein G01um101438_269 [Parcubacteria group bacterium Gr01-1014_38]|nr:MAG: hypothetical protein G01um101438_269 [Parcubacteria group bacterium Gr01-1014_38]
MAMPRTITRSPAIPVVPRRYGGRWVAWSRDGRKIIGSGKTPEEARNAARRAGVRDVAYEWVPPAGERFIGGHAAG